MRDFGFFCYQVGKRCVTGLFLLADAFGLIILITSATQPKVPWQVSIIIFLVTIYAACFSVWKEQKSKTAKANKALTQLKDQIPQYTIEIVEIKKYTARTLIEKYEKLITEINPKTQSVRNNQGSVHLSSLGLKSAMESMNRMVESLSPAMRSMGVESREERNTRLADHVAELKKFEVLLNQLYQIDLVIHTSHSDKNIETTVTSEGVEEMILEDDYVINNVPQTHEPQPGYSSFHGILSNSSIGPLPSKLYLSSYVEEKQAFSKLSHINAKKVIPLFDDDYFIKTTSSNITLQFLIHSEGRSDPQPINMEVDLTDFILETLEEGEGEDC